MLFKLSNLNSDLALILGYLNPALNNSAQAGKTFSYHNHVLVTLHVQFFCADWLKFDG